MNKSDIISLAIIGLSLLANFLQSKSVKLPTAAQPVVKKLGKTTILEAIEIASKFDTQEERRMQAANYLKRVADKRFGFALSDSIANMVVEYGVQIYKRVAKK